MLDRVLVKPVHTAMKTIWTKSNWSRKDLDGKFVEFKLRSGKFYIHAIGEFQVSQHANGLLSICISVDVPETWPKSRVLCFALPQVGVDAIELHEDPAVAQFRLYYIR